MKWTMVTMTDEEYQRWLKSERERSERLEREEALTRMLTVEMDDVWQRTAGRDKTRWPLINLASRNPKQAAFSTKVEWITGGRSLASGAQAWAQGAKFSADFNYTHIFRVPWTELVTNSLLSSFQGSTVLGSTTKRREKLDEMLDQIEAQMRNGVRAYDRGSGRALQMAGGVPSLLGRWPHGDDYVQFSVLRDMTLRRYPSDQYASADVDGRYFDFEYLIELSWIAIRKP